MKQLLLRIVYKTFSQFWMTNLAEYVDSSKTNLLRIAWTFCFCFCACACVKLWVKQNCVDYIRRTISYAMPVSVWKANIVVVWVSIVANSDPIFVTLDRDRDENTLKDFEEENSSIRNVINYIKIGKNITRYAEWRNGNIIWIRETCSYFRIMYLWRRSDKNK